MPDPNGTSAVFQDRGRRWLGAGLALIVLFTIIGTSALPAYRAFKRHRGHKLAERGLAELARGEYEQAAGTVRLALRFAPQEPKAWRLAGRLLTIRPSPDGINYWQSLLGSPEATREDHSGYCQLLLALRRFDLLKKELATLMERDPDDIEALELTAGLLHAEGHLEEAVNILRVARETAPDRRPLQLLLGRSLRNLGRIDAYPEAAGLLWDLALRPCPERAEAVRLLAGWPVLAPNEAELLARITRTELPDSIPLRLLEIELQYRAGKFSDEAGRLAAVRQIIPKADAAADRLHLADWLLAHAAPELALEVASEEACRADGILLQRRLQALAGLRRWDEVDVILRDETAPLAPVARHLFKASFGAAQGQTNDVGAHLKSAAAAAGADPASANLVARYAELLGRHDLAAEALEGLLANPNLVPAISRRLLEIYRRTDDEGPIIETLRRLREFTPDNDTMLNELAWMELVARVELPANLGVASKLAERHPASQRFAATLGLAHLRHHNPDAALRVTDPFPIGPTSDLHLLLVRCAALGSAGQRAAARQVAEWLDPRRLRPREVDLVRAWLPPPPHPPPPPQARR